MCIRVRERSPRVPKGACHIALAVGRLDGQRDRRMRWESWAKREKKEGRKEGKRQVAEEKKPSEEACDSSVLDRTLLAFIAGFARCQPVTNFFSKRENLLCYGEIKLNFKEMHFSMFWVVSMKRRREIFGGIILCDVRGAIISIQPWQSWSNLPQIERLEVWLGHWNNIGGF